MNETMLNKFNETMNGNFNDVEELEEKLNEMYLEEVDKADDLQVAFDNLNDRIGSNLLANYYCYCASDGGEWTISISDKFSQEMLQAFIDDGWDVSDADELASEIEGKVMDTECNVGCDAYTALDLEMEDFPLGYDWEEYIQVSTPEGEPCLVLLDNLD